MSSRGKQFRSLGQRVLGHGSVVIVAALVSSAAYAGDSAPRKYPEQPYRLDGHNRQLNHNDFGGYGPNGEGCDSSRSFERIASAQIIDYKDLNLEVADPDSKNSSKTRFQTIHFASPAAARAAYDIVAGKEEVSVELPLEEKTCHAEEDAIFGPIVKSDDGERPVYVFTALGGNQTPVTDMLKARFNQVYYGLKSTVGDLSDSKQNDSTGNKSSGAVTAGGQQGTVSGAPNPN